MEKPTGSVLFLDISSRVGWCFGCPGDPMPKWGVWLIPISEGFGKAFIAFENVLLDFIDEFQPGRIAVERPIPQRGNNVVTAELTYGLHAIVALHCYRHDLALTRPAVGTIRAKVCGRSKRTDMEKAAKIGVKDAIVLPWIKSMGWGEITSADARDAAAGWAFETGLRAKRRAA